MTRLAGGSLLSIALVCADLAFGQALPERAAAGAASETTTAQIAVTDDTGARLELPRAPQRIVSLSPGATELLFAVGAGQRIVATVPGSDAPAAARGIARLPAAADKATETIMALQPDVVIAWEFLSDRLLLGNLRKLRAPVYLVRLQRFDDLPPSLRRLGALVGSPGTARSLAARLEQRIRTLPDATPAADAPRVFYMISAEPLYTFGARHLVNDALRRCGVRNLYGDVDAPAPLAEIEVVRQRNPDIIVMSAPVLTTRDWRERWAAFPGIRAVRDGRVLDFDAPDLDRMGIGAIEMVPKLCALLATRANLPGASRAKRL